MVKGLKMDLASHCYSQLTTELVVYTVLNRWADTTCLISLSSILFSGGLMSPILYTLQYIIVHYSYIPILPCAPHPVQLVILLSAIASVYT